MSDSKKEEPNVHPSSSSILSPQFKKILIPRDGSEMSDRALKYAIYLSKLSGAELLILNVIEQPDNLLPASAMVFFSPRYELEGIKDNLQRSSQEYSKQILEKAVNLTKVEGIANTSYIIRSGKPVDEIVTISEERNIDLIVMASSRIASTVRILGSNARGSIGEH